VNDAAVERVLQAMLVLREQQSGALWQFQNVRSEPRVVKQAVEGRGIAVVREERACLFANDGLRRRAPP